MTELRACDPTLDSFYREGGDSRVVCSDDTSVRGGMVAHLPAVTLSHRHTTDRVQLTFCGMYQNLGFRVQQARHVRWVAVPCPRCFPDAPLPGHPATCDGGPACPGAPHPHLSWQAR